MIKLILRLCNGFLFLIIKRKIAMQKVKKYKQTIAKNSPKKNNKKSKNKNETDITMANP